MAQRFTDTQKWEDEWFTEMSNDYKIIWIYLLDTCDNAGIWKQNIKLLNFSCGTNISLERLAEIFKGRITKIDTDKVLADEPVISESFVQSVAKYVEDTSIGTLAEEGKVWMNSYQAQDYYSEEYSVGLEETFTS